MSVVTRVSSEFAVALRDVTADFSGVVWVGRGSGTEYEAAHGLADRAHGVEVTPDTRFGIANATAGFTAVTVAALLGTGELSLSTTARSLLGPDLPLVHPDVTVAHLLAHTSGIGEHPAAGDPDDYALRRPPHRFTDTESYLPALDGAAQRAAPGARFAYSRAGYALLAVLAERAAAAPFPGLVGRHVFGPAQMWGTAFLRTDRMPGDAAVGYLADGRTNTLHLPVRGSGDGGVHTTAADVCRFWTALFDERLLPRHRVAELVRPRHSAEGMRYGRGFWLHAGGPQVMLEGCGPGMSFRSVHDPASGLTHTVLSNTARGAWPVTRRLDELTR